MSLVEITSQGKETLERLLPDLHQAEVAWTAGLTDAQQRALLGGLGRVQHHLQQR